MKFSTRTALSFAFEGIAWLFFVAAGISFWFGGGVAMAVFGTDRAAGEVGGVLFAMFLAGAGVVAKNFQDRVEDGEGPKSLGEALRKSSDGTRRPEI